MNKNKEYNRSEMHRWLEEHFKKCGYEVSSYDPQYHPVRVPLYCKKEENDKLDELVVDFTTFRSILKNTFFSSKKISGVKIKEASAISFYQYYFIQAKTYFAYPDYAIENNEFIEFKKICIKKGIGLLKVSKKKITVTIEARSLYEEICNELSIKNTDVKSKLEYYLRNFLHYFVYYPEPEFKRRAITGRTEGDISFILIDKLCELQKISYKEKLIDLASNYRDEARDDYKIALETIKELWSKILKVEYPEIQRQLEDILLRNSEYRDHFLHQFQVFLLGIYIIDKLYDNEKCIKEFEHLYECPIENAWLLVSTYHDFNYSIQAYNVWIKEFITLALNTTSTEDKDISPLKLDAAFIRENFLLKTKEICKALNLEMNNIVMNFFYEQAVKKRNHGLLSALSLLKLFENAKSPQINHSALIQAAVAIALHDWNIWKAFSGKEENADVKWNHNFTEKKFLKILEFKNHPLVFLLIFCDTIQEWGRVGKLYKESEPRLEDITIFSNPNEIKVSFSVKDDFSYENKEREILHVKKFLKDPRFEIELISREGGQTTKISMKGN